MGRLEASGTHQKTPLGVQMFDPLRQLDSSCRQEQERTRLLS